MSYEIQMKKNIILSSKKMLYRSMTKESIETAAMDSLCLAATLKIISVYDHTTAIT